MKWRLFIIQSLLAVAAVPATAAPAPAPDTNAPVKSVFILPTNPGEGRDPFFPNSMRPYEQYLVKRSTHVDLTALVIKGFSDIYGRRYVIINNHTFGPGDEGDVMTPGGRVHIHCLSVTGDSVLVESGGVRHLLRIPDQ